MTEIESREIINISRVDFNRSTQLLYYETNIINRRKIMETKIVTIQDLAGVVSIIDVCSARGAFKGEELAGVGRLRETFLAEVKEQQPDEATAPSAVPTPVAETTEEIDTSDS